MADLHMEGFDVGLEMSGNPRAFNDMLDCMYHGGKIALLGHLPKGAGIDWDKIIFKGLTMQGIYGRKDVRDLVQDDADGADRLPAAEGADAPVADRRLPEGLRPDGRRQVGQGRVELELRADMSLTQPALTQRYADTLDEIRAAGLFKSERIITSPQSAEISSPTAARC
jgi:hypothetical protein